jgi:hypothetical protein
MELTKSSQILNWNMEVKVLAVNPQYARTMIGHWVDCHTSMGIRTGILREVRSDGIVLEMPTGMAGYAAGEVENQDERKRNATEAKIEHSFFSPFFRPFRFFIPFFLLLALTRRRRF